MKPHYGLLQGYTLTSLTPVPPPPTPPPLTAQSAHGADPVQLEPKAAAVPSSPRAVGLGSLLIGQGPFQQPQPGGLGLGGLRLLRPLGELLHLGLRGQGGLLLGLAVQQLLQVVQSQQVIVALQELFHELQ